MATKEHRRHAKGLVEGLETRLHSGPPIHLTEIHSVREFLRQNDFSPASDYFCRLSMVQTRLASRPLQSAVRLQGKRNYGGEAAGYWMQLQSAFDHVILSVCYDGAAQSSPGRIKVSHRFNQAGRIDFVELKFLRSTHACLNGEMRKLLMVKDYQQIRKDWHQAEAFVLPVLPRELVFLYPDIFRCPRNDLYAWLVKIGHRLLHDLLTDLRTPRLGGPTVSNSGNRDQLCLQAILSDEVALPILQASTHLEPLAELVDSRTVELRYLSQRVDSPFVEE